MFYMNILENHLHEPTSRSQLEVATIWIQWIQNPLSHVMPRPYSWAAPPGYSAKGRYPDRCPSGVAVATQFWEGAFGLVGGKVHLKLPRYENGNMLELHATSLNYSIRYQMIWTDCDGWSLRQRNHVMPLPPAFPKHFDEIMEQKKC